MLRQFEYVLIPSSSESLKTAVRFFLIGDPLRLERLDTALPLRLPDRELECDRERDRERERETISYK